MVALQKCIVCTKTKMYHYLETLSIGISLYCTSCSSSSSNGKRSHNYIIIIVFGYSTGISNNVLVVSLV